MHELSRLGQGRGGGLTRSTFYRPNTPPSVPQVSRERGVGVGWARGSRGQSRPVGFRKGSIGCVLRGQSWVALWSICQVLPSRQGLRSDAQERVRCVPVPVAHARGRAGPERPRLGFDSAPTLSSESFSHWHWYPLQEGAQVLSAVFSRSVSKAA